MSFIAGTGKTNVDILYAGLKRLPQLGEELPSGSMPDTIWE